MKKEKKENSYEWITLLKVVLCISIIIIHIILGWRSMGVSTSSYYRVYYIDSIFLQPIIRFDAIPCFLMITGCLLLDPKKEIDFNKIKKYLLRIVGALAIFGFAFCFIENIFNYGFNNISNLLYKSFINLISGNSWAHMWYLYMLIGIYIITPILRSFVKNCDQKTIKFILISLLLLANFIPTINKIFSLNITTFNLDGLNYLSIYLLGYYFIKTDLIKDKIIYIIGVLCLILTMILNYFGYLDIANNMHALLIPTSMMIIKLFQNKIKIRYTNIWNFIANNSFGIYIIHVLYINIIYKKLHIYPDILPIFIGELLFLVVIFALSLLTVLVLKKIPIIKKVL